MGAVLISRSIKFLCLIVMFAAIDFGTAHAQSPQDPGARFLDERKRERDLERLKNAQPGQKIVVAAPIRVEREAVCFPINTIRLRGVTVLDGNELSGLIEAYKDTCMGQNAIGALLQLINKTYVEAGYITTRAYVPQQDLKDGELIIDVIEGKIEGFVYRVVDKDGKIEAGKPRKISSAFPTKPGDVFQLRKIEQGLDQINRLASSQATVDLLPGSQPGTSLVVVTERKIDLYRGTVAYDNKGSDSTGIDRYRLSFEADDVLSLNEFYSVSYLGTQNTNVVAYNYSIPYGYWTFSSSGSYSESLSGVTATSDLFNQTGSASVQLERLLSRDATQKTYAYVNAGYYWNSRFINVAQLTPQNRTAISGGIRSEYYLENGVFSVDLGMTHGVPFFGADGDLPVLAPDTPRAEFEKFDYSLSYLHRFKNGSRLSSSLFGQWSDDSLFSNEQLTIGGWDSVRGFHGDEASGEQGFTSRNELSFQFPEMSNVDPAIKPKSDGWSKFYNENIRAFSPYLFVDVGYVRNLALQDTSTMIGAGLGIRGSLRRASIDAALAFPLTQHNLTQPGDIQGLVNVSFKLY